MLQQSSLINRHMSPPRASHGVINRPRLTTLSNLLLQHRLCLVHAPAGSGKTTLLAQWYAALKETGVTTVWYSTNETDGDPLGFADGLIKAVETSVHRNGAAIAPLDQQDALASLVAILMRCASLTPLALFIDDYHLAEGGDGGETINRVLAACVPQLTIVLASRNRPPIAIGRLRVSGEILEVPVEELFFRRNGDGSFFPGIVRHLVNGRGKPSDARLYGRLGGGIEARLARTWQDAWRIYRNAADRQPPCLRRILPGGSDLRAA